MRHITGNDRRQVALFPISLEDSIEQDNTVRAIDTFVNGLELGKLGFKVHFPENGRPAYLPATLLKLYILRVHEQGTLHQAARKGVQAQY